MNLNRRFGRWLLLSFVSLAAALQAWGQNVTLNLRSSTPDRAVMEIQKMYGYSVVVRSEGLDMDRPISVSIVDEDIRSALAKIFAGQDVVIEVSGRNVSVSRLISPPPYGSGRVLRP